MGILMCLEPSYRENGFGIHRLRHAESCEHSTLRSAPRLTETELSAVHSRPHQNRPPTSAVAAPACRYQAEVSLDVYRADPATVGETPISDLPLDIMPFPLPSRFVPSDGLTESTQLPIDMTGTAVWHVREDGLLQHSRVERNAHEVHRLLTARQRP